MKPRALLIVLLLATTGCTAVIGGSAALVGIGAALIFKSCDDFVRVTVRDAFGHPTCNATVVARSEDAEVEFSPCFSGYLSDGTWMVEARDAVGVQAFARISVRHDGACEPAVHSADLALRSAIPAPTQPLAPAAAPAPAAPAPAPAPASASAPAPSSSVPTANFDHAVPSGQ